jgi:hypothetical protein
MRTELERDDAKLVTCHGPALNRTGVVAGSFGRTYAGRASFLMITNSVPRDRPIMTRGVWVAPQRPREHRPRRRWVGTGPRRARAPARLGDDDEHHDVAVNPLGGEAA